MSTNNDQWWNGLTDGEKLFLRTLMHMIRMAKQSTVRDVARAARQWETGLGCFIKVRLKNRRR
jgi:hypothetical protein